MTRSWLFAALALGALMRALALPLPGTLDVPDWKATSYVASSDFLRIYGNGGSPPDERRLEWQHVSVTTEYPPISQLEMAAVGKIYRRVDPAFGDSTLLTALIKSPGLLAEIAFVTFLLVAGPRLFGARAATWAALAFWLNPAIWLAGATLGYLDAQMAVPATLALLAAASRRPVTAGLLGAVAILTKPQALFIVPVIGLLVVDPGGARRWRDGIRASVAGTAVFAAAFAPFVIAGTFPSYVRAAQRMGEHDLVSGTATNLWWIFSWAAGSLARLGDMSVWEALSRPATMVRISTVVEAGWPNPRTVGTLATVAAIAWASWRGWGSLSRVRGAALAAWCVLAYFMLSGQVHENHAYLALPLLAVAAAEDRTLRPMFWAVSAAFFLNLYLFYGFGQTWPPVIERSWTFIDLAVLHSVAYAGVVVWLTTWVASGDTLDRTRHVN